LLVASTACQAIPAGQLRQLGYECAPTSDPYAAMLEICQRPLVYRAVVISLQSLYREELAVIWTIKQRYPHLEVFLTQTDGRQAALAEGMRLGADGLLAEDGLHRLNDGSARPMEEFPHLSRTADTIFDPPPAVPDAADELQSSGHDDPMHADVTCPDEPLLTADELRALLEEPTLPASGGHD